MMDWTDIPFVSRIAMFFAPLRGNAQIDHSRRNSGLDRQSTVSQSLYRQRRIRPTLPPQP